MLYIAAALFIFGAILLANALIPSEQSTELTDDMDTDDLI